MDRGTERNEARGEVGSLHGELFISSTFTFSDPLSSLCLDHRQAYTNFSTGLHLFSVDAVI